MTNDTPAYAQARYYVRFQEFDPDGGRPAENEWREIEATHMTLVPNAGDYVRYDNSVRSESPELITGKVRSRLFEYGAKSDGEILCTITIVVEPCRNEDWLPLSKD